MPHGNLVKMYISIYQELGNQYGHTVGKLEIGEAVLKLVAAEHNRDPYSVIEPMGLL